ncbi:NnrU family protein [Thermaurantiacus sp.]
MLLFAAVLALFVVSHIALATPPLRDTLVDRMGAGTFQIAYSILSLILLFGAIQIYQGLPEVPMWTAGTGAKHLSNLLMLFASILFVGSLTPANRALAGVPTRPGLGPTGVMRWTRHPMMWAFALWSIVHGWLAGDPPTVVLAGGVGVLALVGAAFQDGKKRKALGADWAAYEAATSYWPFGAQLAGRQGWATLWPGVVPVVGGVLLWLVATFLHPALMKAPVVGIWEFL